MSDTVLAQLPNSSLMSLSSPTVVFTVEVVVTVVLGTHIAKYVVNTLRKTSCKSETLTSSNGAISHYNSTDGANWTGNTGWMWAAGTECNWFRVGCSNGHAEHLDLANNSLSGSMPSELDNLTNLTTLYLYANYLSGSISAELGKLTNLRRRG